MRVRKASATRQEILSHCFGTDCAGLALLADPDIFIVITEELIKEGIRLFLPIFNCTFLVAKCFAKETTLECHVPDYIVTSLTSLVVGLLLGHEELREQWSKSLHRILLTQIQKFPVKVVCYDIQWVHLLAQVHETNLFSTDIRQSVVDSCAFSWNPFKFVFVLSQNFYQNSFSNPFHILKSQWNAWSGGLSIMISSKTIYKTFVIIRL